MWNGFIDQLKAAIQSLPSISLGPVSFSVPSGWVDNLRLALGGIVQGFKLVNPNVAFLDVTKSTLMFLRLGTVGELLMALGNALFLLNVLAVIARYYRAVCTKAYAVVTARLEPTPDPSHEGNAGVRV